MEPPHNGDESGNSDDFLIDAARREVLGNGGDDGEGRGPAGDAPGGETVATPHSSDLIMPHDDQAGQGGAPRSPDTQTAAPSVKLIPKRIGHYHVRRLIASGGMGTVYEATQEHPRRTVAIKVMRHGITSARALRRFEYEAQILARLHHPGIAHVYEADWHEEEGERVPYFAMEYIPNAKPLLRYADEKHLSSRARLKLFIDVCQAVHHGHQRGIIHRDLKPGNILVDPGGQVKIIDFGVARSTDADLNLTALQTSVGEMVGTLKYMSPEQCEADPHDLDIRSDIYSLGVLLFELLSGRMPYDLYSTPVISAPRVICEEPPTRLSSINRSLRGDIETIVGKALEKDRRRRYQSTLTLGDDIGHYLNDEPISARPPSAVYRLRKLVRRRRTPLAVAAVLFALGAALIVREVWARNLSLENERLAARIQRVENERLATQLLIAKASNTLLDWGKFPIDLPQMLQTCDRVIELDDKNAAAYAMRARVHFRSGDNSSAERDCTKALELEPENIVALRTCAYTAQKRGDFDLANELYDRAFKSYAWRTDLPRDFHNRARVRRAVGRYEGAMEDHLRAVTLAPDFGMVYKGRGVTRYMVGEIDGAIEDLERAASLSGNRQVQCYLWLWEMRMMRKAPGDSEAAEEALNKAEQAAQGHSQPQGLIAVWRGQREPDEYLSSLEATDRAQGSYYLGARALVEGRKEEAVAYFRGAAVRAFRGQDEYDLAHWHLRRLESE